jgi:hypothetical protein
MMMFKDNLKIMLTEVSMIPQDMGLVKLIQCRKNMKEGVSILVRIALSSQCNKEMT